MALRGGRSFLAGSEIGYGRPGCLMKSCTISRPQRQRITPAAAARRGHLGNSCDGDSESTGPSQWAANNVASGQLYAGNLYSHNLPWKDYTHMMFLAIEAEVESKEGMQAAYSQHSQGPAAGQRQQCSQPGSMLSESPELTNKLQQALEAHLAAKEYREAAEAESQRLFDFVRRASSLVETERRMARSISIEIDEAIQTGIQMAKDKWIEALRVARSVIDSTQKALAVCADKIRLEMTLQPRESELHKQQEAALQKLQELRDDTMADLAAEITAQFLPSCSMSTAEARQWLEKTWQMGEDSGYDTETDA